jgi:putative methyltransferase (TIGR04325 family)
MGAVRDLARDWVPPAIWHRLRRLAGPGGGFAGDYRSWDAAAQRSVGYDDASIVDRVLDATLKVRAGEADFERDSVLFHQPEPRYPLLAELLQAAIESGYELKVLEFGGSLGSLYFQHKDHFRALRRVVWGVVEQPKFVAAGRAHLEDLSLRFFASIQEAVEVVKPDICIASCVLQYLPQPRETALELLRAAPRTVLDRMAIVDGQHDRLTVQTVPSSIYRASYPAWFLGRSGWTALVRSAGHRIVNEFASIDVLELDGRTMNSVGWVVKRGTP